MKNIRIIIMGKTGVGKSTIINSVLGEYRAVTGDGAAITRENQVYECSRLVYVEKNGEYSAINCNISLYDTVGLEVDRNITQETLKKIKVHIEDAKRDSSDDDVNIVWFCINERSNRFESYEADLIKQLSMEYEIPFVIVLTQCISKKEGRLAQEIQKRMPTIPIRRIMAQDYEFDEEVTIRAFGLDELIKLSINDYYHYRIRVIESVIDELSTKSEEKIKEIESDGGVCIFCYSDRAGKIGWVPGGCIPFVHGLCIKMIAELNGIGGLSKDQNFADEIFADIVVGIIATPFMAIPLFSKIAAESYIESVGESYLEAMLDVIRTSAEIELKDKKLMKERIKERLNNENE